MIKNEVIKLEDSNKTVIDLKLLGGIWGKQERCEDTCGELRFDIVIGISQVTLFYFPKDEYYTERGEKRKEALLKERYNRYCRDYNRLEYALLNKYRLYE
jgi:hypothetical protein